MPIKTPSRKGISCCPPKQPWAPDAESIAAVLCRRLDAADKSLRRAATHAVLIETSGRLARAIESGNNFSRQVDYLALRIDAQPGSRVVHDRRRPGRVKRGCLNLVFGRRLTEV